MAEPRWLSLLALAAMISAIVVWRRRGISNAGPRCGGVRRGDVFLFLLFSYLPASNLYVFYAGKDRMVQAYWGPAAVLLFPEFLIPFIWFLLILGGRHRAGRTLRDSVNLGSLLMVTGGGLSIFAAEMPLNSV